MKMRKRKDIITDRENNKKKGIHKGDRGYIDRHKMIQLLTALGLLVIVVIIYYTGIIKYHNTKNIFTVMAAVSAIPAAKFAVSYIVMIPYQSSSKEQYERLQKCVNAKILSDMLLSSPDKIIHVEFAGIRDNAVYCFISNQKYEKVDCEKYIRSFLETECKISAVRVFQEFDKFERAISALDKNEAGRYDKRIAELMLVYSM